VSSTLASPLQAPRSELLGAFRGCRLPLIGCALFSCLINLLALTSSLYMLQVYDRVIPAHSVPTLIGISVIMLLLFAVYGLLDVLRTKIMSRIGVAIDRQLRERVFRIVLLLPIRTANRGDGMQAVRDLDQIRGFLSGAGPTALFDLPWMPFYITLVFLLHPWLGILALAGAVTLFSLTLLTEFKGRGPARSAAASGVARQQLGEAGRRNAEVIRALGMSSRFNQRWAVINERHLAEQLVAADTVALYGNISKVLRLLLQSAVLGLGAYLTIIGQASGGVMIASSILVSRSLAPIEIAIANWRGFLAARQSAERLTKLLATQPARLDSMPLPQPRERLNVDGLWVAAPGQQRVILQNITFALKRGDGLGVIGPSASGKSTLARALVGVWVAQRGTIRLDGAALDQWSPDLLGPHIGYLPQDIELFDGTVAQNIARFDPQAGSEAIIAAANDADVHDMILRLPNGYETTIGEAGAALSAGQRQRVALARALYGAPFLLVLDEPNSNLDADGDAALTRAISSVRERGGIVIVIAHRPSALAGLDQVMVLGAGQVQAFGPRDEVLRQVMQTPAAQNSRLKVVPEGLTGNA